MNKLSYIPYKTSLTKLARQNRRFENMTKAERFVWYLMLNKKRTRYKFIRQKPIGIYIIDYYCSQLKLGIEIDGISHINAEDDDLRRETYLSKLGIEIIRYTNEQVLNNPAGMYYHICEQLKERKRVLNPASQT